MTNITRNDIVTEDEIQDAVIAAQEETLQFQRAFGRTLNVPNINNDTVTFYLDADTMGEPQEIRPGMEFPMDEEDVTPITATVAKYGLTASIAQENIDDSLFDVVAMNIEKKARKMNELTNRLAFNELDANLHTNSPVGDNGGTLEFDEIVDGRTELRDDGYNPTILITDPQGEADLIKSDEFQRATDFFDGTILEGSIGRVAGLDVFVDNHGLMSANDAYIIDPSEYGVVVVKDMVGTDQWDDPARQAMHWNIWWRGVYKTLKSDAAIKIQG